MKRWPHSGVPPIGRRTFLTRILGAGAVAFYSRSALQLSAEEPAGKPLRITFFTDIHARTEWETPVAMLKAAHVIREQPSDLIICGGDIITDGFQSRIGGVTERWAKAREMFAAIEKPIHMAIGNHDLVGADPDDGSPPASNPRDPFLSFSGQTQTYQSLDVHGHHVIFLDPFKMTQDNLKYKGLIETGQIHWLKQDLQAVDPDTPIILVCHMPLLTAFYQMTRAATAPAPSNRVLTNNIEVLKLFEGHNLRLVLQGHLHVQEVMRWRGITFITGGAVCGKWWRGCYHGTCEGIGSIYLTNHSVDWTYVPIPWTAKRPRHV